MLLFLSLHSWMKCQNRRACHLDGCQHWPAKIPKHHVASHRNDDATLRSLNHGMRRLTDGSKATDQIHILCLIHRFVLHFLLSYTIKNSASSPVVAVCPWATGVYSINKNSKIRGTKSQNRSHNAQRAAAIIYQVMAPPNVSLRGCIRLRIAFVSSVEVLGLARSGSRIWGEVEVKGASAG